MAEAGTMVNPLRDRSLHTQQARQESNLQPPVLETGALPIELRTFVLRCALFAVRCSLFSRG